MIDEEHFLLPDLMDAGAENETDTDEVDDPELIGLALLQPVLMSSLKFAAYGKKFLYNYIKNLPHYVRVLNEKLVSGMDHNIRVC